jgi:hypothetical protein
VAKQLFLNNFDFLVNNSILASPMTGTPDTEVGYGVIQISAAASSVLAAIMAPNTVSGNWFYLTIFKLSASVESQREIVKVVAYDEASYVSGIECRLRVLRGQEGTTIQAYTSGDRVSMRFTKAGADGMLQAIDNLASVSSAATARSNIGAAKSGANSDITSLLNVELTGTVDGAALTTYFANPPDVGISTPAPSVSADVINTDVINCAGNVGGASGTFSTSLHVGPIHGGNGSLQLFSETYGWLSTIAAADHGATGAIYANTAVGSFVLANNFYINTSNQPIAKTTGVSTGYKQNTAGHTWTVNASALFGAVVTETTGMNLDLDANLKLAGSIGTKPPVLTTASTYTVLAGDASLVANFAGTSTYTLPSAATYPGRILNLKTIQAQAVVSASSNVSPLAGGSAGTAILSATAGKWAMLQSDGTNWVVMAGN